MGAVADMTAGGPLPLTAARIPLYGADGEPRAFAIVDWEDYERFGGQRWHVAHGGYARRWAGGRPPARRSYRLHREVMGLPPMPDDPERRQVDHINRNPLDNRKANLRIVTEAQNHQNVPAKRQQNGRPCTSEYRGVSWDKSRQRWVAYGTVTGRRVHVGYFTDEQIAAEAAAEWRRANLPFATN